MKLLPSVFLLALLFSCNCTSFRQQVQAEEAAQRRGMQSATVQIFMDVALMAPDGTESVINMSCSGVVVDRAGGLVSEPRTLIATAHHCLDMPASGRILQSGSLVLASLITVVDFEGKACELKTVALGGYGADDVATGVADCDLGRVARLASEVPELEGQVYISGHPQGVYPGIITTGYFAGWLNGWMLVSAPAFGGNSGGPVFNVEGEVVGLLVRGSPNYPLISLASPLGELQARIQGSVW